MVLLAVLIPAVLTLAVGCTLDSEDTEAIEPSASTAAISQTTSPDSTPIETTSPTTTPTSTSSTAPPPPAGDLVLSANGLGVVSFGETPDSAVPLLVEILGRQPTNDSTMTGEMPDGLGGGDTTVRLVRFGRLSVTFTDWPYYREDGVMHFVRWILFDFEETGANGLATAEGITLGSTVDELRAAYGEQLILPEELDECTGGWPFSVRGSGDPALQGMLDGPPTGSATVTMLSAGAQSTC